MSTFFLIAPPLRVNRSALRKEHRAEEGRTTLSAVPVRSKSESYWGAGGPPRQSRIEYRLMRESVLAEFRRGRLGRLDICDAQPELLRVARNLGRETATLCPVCEEVNLRHVSFAFGPRLPAQGRALAEGELAKLSRSRGEIACYLVEVCIECSWNHLLRMFTVGGESGNRIR